MSWVVWLLAVPVSAVVTGGGLRAAGLPARRAAWAGAAAGAATAFALLALLFTGFIECGQENPDPPPPPSWPWSPRRAFCDEPSSPAALGSLALLLVPTAAITLGGFLRSKQKTTLGWAAYAVLLATPILPSLYINALPYFRLDSYPVLHQPLLRPATGSQPARVCYVYGIVHGPRTVQVTPATTRHCVELEPTPEALSLTSSYDEGRTVYDLDWMGKKLTQKGLPIRDGDTGVAGLVVERAYKLADSQARIGATLVE